VLLVETFVSAAEYRVQIPANFLLTPGTAFIQELDVDGSEYTPRPYVINPVPLITTLSLPAATLGNAFTALIAASGGTRPLVWSAGSALPAGLTLNPNTGGISGSPSAAGIATIRFTVRDAVGVTSSRDFVVTVNSTATPLTISTASPLTPGKAGLSYTLAFAASGGTSPYTWAISAGSAPPGLILSPAGVLSGSARVIGAFTFTVRVTDSVATTATKEFLIQVTAPTVSCVISPRNAFLPGHQPGYHLGARPFYPDHTLAVDVTADSAPAASAALTVQATQPVFGPAGVLPSSASQNEITDSMGRATFRFNPPASESFTQTDFQASGVFGTASFACQGAVVTGMGAITRPLNALIESQNAAVAIRNLGGAFSEYHAAFAAELEQLYSTNPNLRRRIDRLARQSRRTMQREARDPTLTPPTPAALREALAILTEVEDRARPQLRAATKELRLLIEHGPIGAYLGVPQPRASVREPAARTTSMPAAPFAPDYGRMPLVFEPYFGPHDRRIRFVARGPGYSYFFGRTDAILLGVGQSLMELSGANRASRPEAEQQLGSSSHYLQGKRSRWHTHVPQFARIRYRSVYRGVDLALYGNDRTLQFDFIVAPGADPANIQLVFRGAEEMDIDSGGDLIVRQRSGDLRLGRPIIYQNLESGRKEVQGGFEIRDRTLVGFRLDSYDRSRPLVIDPIVDYSSYLGGSGVDAGTQVAVDAHGNAYITGATQSANFPGTAIRGGAALAGSDVFVTKLDPNGKVIYSTYVGGTGDDAGLAIAIDSQGSAYVAGVTMSPNFPTRQPAQSKCASGTLPDLLDAFVFKLDPSGSNMVYSTCFGGAGVDLAKGIAIGPDGSAYITGSTNSNNLPVRNAFQPAPGGKDSSNPHDLFGTDAFVAKLNASGSEVAYATYLGGGSGEVGAGITVDGSGAAYVTGTTYSANFPLLRSLQNAKRGPSDVFVTKIAPSGSNLVYSTFVGGQSDDLGAAIALDSAGGAYVTGATGSPDFPLANPAQKQFGDPAGLGLDAFAFKLAPDGAQLQYSTWIGGRGSDVGMGIAVGPDGGAYIAGETNSADFPSINFSTNAGRGEEGFLVRLSPAGSEFVYAGQFGGGGADSAIGVAVDAAGAAIVAGLTDSVDFPLSYGAYQISSGGSREAIVLKVREGVPVSGMRTTSAASAAPGPVAPGSIATSKGQGLASQTEIGSGIELTLSGTSVAVKDSAGAERQAALYYVSPEQINYVIPANSAIGLASITVLAGAEARAVGTVLIESVAPSLFSANANGAGTAAATSLTVRGNDAQSSAFTFQCQDIPEGCTGVPIDFGDSSTRVYVSLYGTGIERRSSLDSVLVSVNGETVPVHYAGPQSEYPGLDQLNIGPLPRTLIGLGEVELVLTVDGKRANTVKLTMR
jgi:uncharacterized protein (TIGR03437 family)